MPLNPDAVGYTTEPFKASWNSKAALLYAVGVGAGTGELAYTTENTKGVPQQVLPTFPVVMPMGEVFRSFGTFDLAMLVHGSQAVTLHKALPVEAEVTVIGRVVSMYDKGKAAVVTFQAEATDDADGLPLYTSRTAVFIRGEGGWGGDRGPSGPQNVPPERAPDHEVTYQTSPDQALVYRLSGDRNPLHSDPEFAKRGGFDRPILHGLCSYGFTGRALLHTFCGGESARFRHIEARFANPVLPGEALTVSMWEAGAGEALFTTSVGDRTVIDQGLLKYDA